MLTANLVRGSGETLKPRRVKPAAPDVPIPAKLTAAPGAGSIVRPGTALTARRASTGHAPAATWTVSPGAAAAAWAATVAQVAGSVAAVAPGASMIAARK